MIKDDITVIRNAILGEEFALPKKQVLNNTIKINSNKNLNIESHESVCDYKLNCYSNIFDNFEIYFNSIFNMINSKEKIFDTIKSTSRNKMRFQNEVNVSIEKLGEFYKKNSLKEELFKTHILGKQSINFGKISNFFYNNVLNETLDSTYKENKEIGRSQEVNFEIFDKNLLVAGNFKRYFLLNIEDMYDESSNIVDLENVNINTYICQNLINITRSLFTLHSGSLENVNSANVTNIANESENLICVTSEADDLNFFKYNNAENMSFDYNSFYNNDYINWSKNISSVISGGEYSETTIQRVTQEPNRSIKPVNYNTQKDLNVSQSTLALLADATIESAKKYWKIHNEFYQIGSTIQSDLTFQLPNTTILRDGLTKFVSYEDIVREVEKSFTDIYDIDLSVINIQKDEDFNKWLFTQSNITGNENFSSDITLQSIKESSFYNSINFDAITSKFLWHNQYESNKGKLLMQSGYASSEEYDAAKEEIFNNEFNDKLNNIDSSHDSSAALKLLVYNLKNNSSMIYYLGRPIYEVVSRDFDPDSFSLLHYPMHNEYNIFDKDLINARIAKGSNYLSLKTDCIVKKVKANSLKKSNVDIDLFKEISNAISNKSTINKIIAYSNDINSNIVLSDTESKLFNLLFTKDDEIDDKFYSNFSITHKEEGFTKYSNYLDLLKRQIEPSSGLEENIVLINNILKNYYKGKYFKSSALLLKSVIGDVINEAKNSAEFQKYDDIALGQYLYLFYFKNKSLSNTESDSYNIIAKRFIKKSIEQSKQYTGTKSFQEFKFNTSEIDYADYTIKDDTSRADVDGYVEDFLSKYFKSNNSLNKIKKTVFGNRNLDKITSNCSFEKTQNIRINLAVQEIFSDLIESLDYTATLEDRTEEDVLSLLQGDAYKILLDSLETSLSNSNLEISFDLLKCVLPFKYFFKSCTLNKNTTNVKDITSHHLVPSAATPFKFVNKLFNVNKRYEEGVISVDCLLANNKTGAAKRSINITDKFDEIFDKNKGVNTVFGSISNKILDMMHTIDYDFRLKEFSSEAEVDSFIEENKFLIDLVAELLEVYGSIYSFYLETLNQETTLRLLGYSSKNQDSFFENVNVGDVYSFNLNYLSRSDNTESLQIDNICSASIVELERLYNYYSNNIEEFIGYDTPFIRDNNLRFTRELETVLKTLTTSDVYQSISFDLLMQNFNFYLKNNKQLNYLDLKNKVDISGFDIENIIMNFFNKNYMNAFYNKKAFLNEYNKLFDDKVKYLTDTNSLSSIDVFDIEKKRELRKINSLNVNTVNSNVLNSDLYSYTVNLEDLKKVNYDSIIKLKIEIIDHSRLDRLFLPKVLYFSPMLFASDLYSINDDGNSNEEIGVYNSLEHGDARIKYITLEKLKSLSLFRNSIIKNFNIDSLEINSLNRNEVYDSIIEEIHTNHVESNSIENVIDAFYNIKLDEKQISNKISVDTFSIFKNDISNDMFFDLFNTNKDIFIEQSFVYEIEEDCYYIETTKDKYEKIVMFIKYLNNILSNKNDENILNNIDNFINLNFSILTNEFIFILNNSNEMLEDADQNTQTKSRDSISNIDRIKYFFEGIDINSLSEYGVFEFFNQDNVDNYSISITAEVI